jgi:hypothetical protein
MAYAKLTDMHPLSLSLTTATMKQAFEDSELLSKLEVSLYRKIVGKVMYAMVGTRLDIAFTVNFLGRFNSTPINHHMNIALGLLRYLHGTTNLGITYNFAAKPLQLVAYADADWAGSLIDRKSTSGFFTLINGSSISWESRKQSVVALSSTEAEYISLSQATKEVIWLRSLLSDLGHIQSLPTVIFEDNQPAINLSENPGNHCRSKHIEVQYHFTREKVESGEVDIIHCPTNNQMADIMTKPSGMELFTAVRDEILRLF